MTTVFQRIGPFEILSQIGEGGMGLVFLAEDTRTKARVAIKLVTRRDVEILEAERRGVQLQARLSEVCPLVPKVFEFGDVAPSYFYISMEYIEGENLSDVIARGPVEPSRAAAIALEIARFLDTAHHFDARIDGRASGALVHGDLKPRNVRIAQGGDIKVLDFGIAKALSLSRKVTRNDFGSLPYMSPERLDSVDSEIDPSADLWALGVILYELLTGLAPFRAPDSRRLEQQIRSGVPQRPVPESVPLGLRAICARLLSPAAGTRYPTAKGIIDDLGRFLSGDITDAEREGFPSRVDDVATRRTRRGADEVQAGTPRPIDGPDEEDATRRTRPPQAAVSPPPVVSTVPHTGAPPVTALPSRVPGHPPAAPRRSRRITFRGVLLFAAIFIVVNEINVRLSVREPAAMATTIDHDGIPALWETHARLADRSWLGIGIRPLQAALRTRSLELAQQVMANYRGPVPTVRERQWTAAQRNLQLALALAPRDTRIKAALRYCDGHLLRIDGDAEKARGRRASANRYFADAVVAFREAAELQKDWPDPFLGLARTFIYGLEDIDRAADALKQAQARGYRIGAREQAQLGDGYRVRGDRLRQTARQLASTPQEEEYLQRALAAYREAREQYERVPDYDGIGGSLQRLHRAVADVEARLHELAWARGEGIF